MADSALRHRGGILQERNLIMMMLQVTPSRAFLSGCISTENA
jgi:hypothetical protein